MDNALFNFLLRLARRQKPSIEESIVEFSSNEARTLDSEDPPTVSLRYMATAELAASYMITRREIATEDELLVIGTPLFKAYEKLSRELYRRAIQQSDLSFEIDSRHYLIAPKAHNQIEMIEIQ